MIIGVDGGGTHTLAVGARPDGTVVAYARGPGINYYKIGMEKARENLRVLVNELTAQSGCGYAELCIGMSALDAQADAETVRAFAGAAFDADKIDMQSDAYTALIGFTLGKPGMIVICGTGSIIMLLDGANQTHVSGGWGHLLYDAASSYALASEGLRAAIDAWEGVGIPTTLCEAATVHFDLQTPRMLIEKIYAPDATPDKIALFARDVLTHAAAGDMAAKAIVERQLDHLAAQAAGLLRQHPEVRQAGLYGGVFQHHALARERFAQLLREKAGPVDTRQLSYPPEIGALIHCFMKRGTLSDALLDRLRQSYRQFVQGLDL